MTHHSAQFAPFLSRMEQANLPDIFIRTFAHYYGQLVGGVTGLIPETEIEPVHSLPDAAEFGPELAELGQRMLSKTAVIKLNGGLGTSMGLEGAKSLLLVKDQLSFLDIIVQQTLYHGVPLILMDSFNTQEDSLAHLSRYPALQTDKLPQSFLQHKEPKICQADLLPAVWPTNPALEWCPPGHGDIYAALLTSGTLDALLAAGYDYAFVSNADNLGAVIDVACLGYFAQQQLPFMMEVADRTEMDKKGGHLAQRSDGQLILRESAQCADEDVAAFRDISRYKYFNTNNLWFHLPTLQQIMRRQDGMLPLPIIRNRKTVDPRDASSTAVYQLETAMGSAISVFPNAQAIRVPRTRFAPVKTSQELLLVRSDAYCLTDDFRVVPNEQRPWAKLTVSLDPDYFTFVSDLEERFAHGIPSLIACSHFEVQGDVYFGRDVVCRGEVRVINQTAVPVKVPDGSVLTGITVLDELYVAS